MVERLAMFVTGIVVCLILERVIGDIKAHYENQKVDAANRLEAERGFRKNLNSLENRILSVEDKNNILEENNVHLQKACDFLNQRIDSARAEITRLELESENDS